MKDVATRLVMKGEKAGEKRGVKLGEKAAFERVVKNIMKREGISKVEAEAKARELFK